MLYSRMKYLLKHQTVRRQQENLLKQWSVELYKIKYSTSSEAENKSGKTKEVKGHLQHKPGKYDFPYLSSAKSVPFTNQL